MGNKLGNSYHTGTTTKKQIIANGFHLPQPPHGAQDGFGSDGGRGGRMITWEAPDYRAINAPQCTDGTAWGTGGFQKRCWLGGDAWKRVVEFAKKCNIAAGKRLQVREQL